MKNLKNFLTQLKQQNYQVGKKWIFDDYSYLCKGLHNEENNRARKNI
ncbi:hypothetical protein [uncultured Gammaproteobacteria bacterium]|jgi:hypothetical protein|nr:hypothetical protein [uncultured Gammaproteobacteria bacterium]